MVRPNDESTGSLTRALRGMAACDASSADRSPPASCGRFVGLVELGRGASSVVYEAYDPEAERRVAVKVYHHPDSAEMVARESRVLARLEGARCPTLIERGVANDGRAYLAMTIVPGAISARAWIEARDAHAELGHRVCAWEFFDRASRALASMHERGIVHRDIKPSNILIDARGGVWIIDLGLAKGIGDDSGGTAHGDRLGTRGYTSPEQRLSPSDVAPSTDIYALGRVFEQIRPKTSRAEWDRFVRRLIDIEPSRRPKDGSELVGFASDLQRRRPYHRGTGLALLVGFFGLALFGGFGRTLHEPEHQAGHTDRFIEMFEHAFDAAEHERALTPEHASAQLVRHLQHDPSLELGVAGIALAMYLERTEHYEAALSLTQRITAEGDPAVSPSARALSGRLKHRMGDLAGAKHELEAAARMLGPWNGLREKLWLSAVLID